MNTRSFLKFLGVVASIPPHFLSEVEKNKVLPIEQLFVDLGEQFLLLTYLGEGFYKVWYKGQILQSSMEDSQFKKLSEPKSIWWVKIKNRKGQIGWTKLTENFDNMDSCG